MRLTIWEIATSAVDKLIRAHGGQGSISVQHIRIYDLQINPDWKFEEDNKKWTILGGGEGHDNS